MVEIDPRASTILEARGIWRRFGAKVALSDISFAVHAGEVHALLGPNGAGKTTLLRIFCGLLAADAGTTKILGLDPLESPRLVRRSIGFVPSGDRTFYLRLSGLENLAFFGRLHGLSRHHAVARARSLLAELGLSEFEQLPVGRYSQGMQRRLAIARALLMEPPLFLVDEATHTLDPRAAREVRGLFGDLAARGAAVVWTTQRVEEIRGFANKVTIIGDGQVRFSGSVPELMAHALQRRYVLRLENGRRDGEVRHSFGGLLSGKATLTRALGTSHEHYMLALADDAVLGDALESLSGAGIRILGCHEERPEIEDAFLTLTGETAE